MNPQTGEVVGRTAARHTGQEFVAFLEEIVATQRAERDVHVILDNFSTQKTDLVKHFLEQHANVRLHFTPTYSSWLNQVESWFSKLQRDVIDRGIFTSVADLKRKILRTSASTRRPPNLGRSQTDSRLVAMAQGQPTSRPATSADSGARRTGFRGEREKRSGVKTNRIPG